MNTFKLDQKSELGEDFCVPPEEEAYKKLIREPAGGKTNP